MRADEMISLRIDAVKPLAQGVLQFDLGPAAGGDLPAYAPGAHIDLQLPGDVRRSYSLLGCEGVPGHYQIAVLREPASRGGSAWLHESARAGQVLRAARPRNHFTLDEGPHTTILIAGGIGITPLWAMAQRLTVLGRPWKLYYRARGRSGAALVDRMAGLVASGQVVLSFSDEATGVRPDLAAITRDAPPDAHLYCCGPATMVDAFMAATVHLAPGRVHTERFSAAAESVPPGGFTVRLARSGKRVVVAPGQSILDAVRDAGVEVPSACRQGVCGACEIPLLAGRADHRDLVLSAAEKASHTALMICCSGALTPELLLDL